jgi:hypothetical protein
MGSGEREEGGGKVLVDLVEEFGHVGEGTGHHAGVDEVEFLGVGPGFFCVVYFEGYIWWYTVGVST